MPEDEGSSPSPPTVRPAAIVSPSGIKRVRHSAQGFSAGRGQVGAGLFLVSVVQSVELRPVEPAVASSSLVRHPAEVYGQWTSCGGQQQINEGICSGLHGEIGSTVFLLQALRISLGWGRQMGVRVPLQFLRGPVERRW